MPWGRLDDSLYDHEKLDDVPTDVPTIERIISSLDPVQLVRVAAIGLWTRAISWCNRFLTDGHVPRGRISKLDGSPELADALVAMGMFEDDATGYLIHDFLHFNPSRAEVLEKRAEDAKRQKEWRDRKKAEKDLKTGHVVSHSVTPNGEPADVTTLVTPLVTAPHARDSRSASRSANPGPSRPGPESLERESPRATPKPERADIAALLERGWPKVTRGQRKVLDEVLDRHDVTGPEFAASVIRNTPADKDPLKAVMDADRLWQEAERRRVEAEEQAWATEKGAERADAAERLADLHAEERLPWLPAGSKR
jgi:hypothetical protein